ncbi:MAG: glycosyltransferase family 4 protein [Chthoniobacterales bacterium]|nr:glycosyltransferase family 4 protein [Chthoniobacterales bacterium]
MTADIVGGVWTYALELARALPQIEFALATMGAPISDEQRSEAAQLRNVTLFPSTYALEWMDHPWSEVDEAGEWLLGVATKFKPDLIHLNGYAHAVLPWDAPMIVVAHSCVLSWWSAVKKFNAPREYNEYRRRVSDGLNAADLVVAPTAAMLESLRSNYDWFGEGSVIFNAREPRLFAPRKKRNSIFAAGRLWDEAKNLAALEAVALRVSWSIEVAGDAAHPNGKTREFKHVHSLGRLSSAELAARLGTSAIYALPARYEPFGLSVVEAALSGCALVLGHIASLREVWGDAALFVDPDDHDALAGTLSHLIEDKARRTDLAQRARWRALEFSPSKMADAYRGAYRDCLRQYHKDVAA